MFVNVYPGIVRSADQVPVFIEVIDIVLAQIHVAFPVIVEHTQIQLLDQIPLFLRHGQNVLAVFFRPEEILGIELVAFDIGSCILKAQGSAGQEAVIRRRHTADRRGVTTQKSVQQRRNVIGTHLRTLCGHIAEQGSQRAAGTAGCDLAGCLQAGKLFDAGRIGFIQADLLIGICGGSDHAAAGLSVREIDGKAIGICHRGRGPVVFDRAAHSFRQVFAFLCPQVHGEMDQVDLIDPGGSGELPGAVAGVGYCLIIILFDQSLCILGEGLERLGQGLAQFCQVHYRQGGSLSPALGSAGADKIINNDLGKLRRTYGGVGRQLGQPVGIIPADARLGLFGSQHIVRVFAEHKGILSCRHQACVKADNIKFNIFIGFQGLLNARQGHGA